MGSSADTAMPRFSIVVLTYARDAILAEVLDRLYQHVAARQDYEVILVDNNVEPAGREKLLERFAMQRYLRSGTNKGVTARNDGIEVARGDYVILLDDDVFIETPDFLDRFAAAFAEDPRLGVVTIRKHVRGETGPRVDLIPHTRKNVDLDRPFPTFRFVGGCVGFRVKTLRAVGGFLSDFFYGLEEIELAYRVIDAGWTIRYSPEIVVEELEHPAGRKSKVDSQTDRLTNKYIMTWLHMPFPQNILNYLFFTPYIVYRARGEIRVGRAIARFLTWLGKDDRPRRKPLSPEAVAYIRSCGGAIWR